ncbi:hypothetical protein KR067_005907, partial [Drosophila pandora]
LLNKFKNLQYEEGDNLTFTSTIKHVINTTHNSPIYSKQYPLAQALEIEVENQVQEMLNQGLIRESNSPYNSPTWVVPKKTDASGKIKYRVVIDYRKLKEITIPDRYPIPNMDEILENLVADALSRQQLNAVEEQAAESCAATIHSERSLTHTIETTDKPLNCFQNQIVLEKARFPQKRSFVLFGNKRRHLIDFVCKETLLDELADTVVPKGVNAIHCDLHTLAMVQDDLVRAFPATKFWHC